MPRGSFYIVEVLADQQHLPQLKAWAGEITRDGDGLYVEDGRLFLIISAASLVALEAVVERLKPDVESRGGGLQIHTMGGDDVADSIHRRADALVLPVEPRAE